MSKSMFPLRSRTRRRAPLTAEQRSDRRVVAVLAAALVGVALLIAYAFRDVPLLVGAVLTLAALVVRVVVDPNNGLLATCAPLPDVHTPPVTGGDVVADLITESPTLRVEPVTALAEAVGVYRDRLGAHSIRALAESNVPTTAIPVVQA